jgi:hypothetical protein
MNSLPRAGRDFDLCLPPRAIRGAVLSLCILLPACGEPPKPVVVVVEKERPVPPFDPTKAFPRIDLPRPPVSRKPEPRAVQAREMAIRRDAEAIEAECREAVGGDWDRWERETAVYRAALKARIDVLKDYDPPRGPLPEGQSEPLEGRNNFPLFETGARYYTEYLYRPEVLDTFRQGQAVVLAHRWLRDRGIDLIFVPAPRMMEVYSDQFLDPAPADGVLAPQVRRMLHELLKEDVEVVDGLPLFRSLRDANPEYLYHTADNHWGPRAMRIAAKEVADRIARYQFGASARYGLPIVKAAPDRFYIVTDGIPGLPEGQYGWDALSPEQQARARLAQTTSHPHVTLLDGQEIPNDPGSPVVIIGNCFVQHFRDQLVKETNLLVNTHCHLGATTEMFDDFLRDPSLLEHCKVVVWVTSTFHLQRFRPLAPQIAAEVRSKSHPP